MDSSKQTADAIGAGIAAFFLGIGSLMLQAWLLTIILPWIFPAAALGIGKAFIIVLFLNLVF
jgi:hypothetical protein